MSKELSGGRSWLTAMGILVIFLAAGVWAIFSLARYERQRDLNHWQITLGVMADSRAAGIRQWIDGRFDVLLELARNGSLQLYVQQLRQRQTADPEMEPAQISYLRNLLRATAERTGFVDPMRSLPPVPANVAFVAGASLSLYGHDRSLICSTPGVADPDAVLLKAMDRALQSGKPEVCDFFLDGSGRAMIGFVVPVFALQMQSTNREPVGVLVGLNAATDTLYPLLVSSDAATDSDESMLIGREGDEIVYLSPLADGTPALKRRMAANAFGLAAASALAHPGIFFEANDYAGTEVLAISRSLTPLPWLLVQKVAADEAMRESVTHQRFLTVVLALALFLVSTFFVALWWYRNTLLERAVAAELREKSAQLEAQSHLLTAINENISDVIFLAGADGKLIFANGILARKLEVVGDDLRGKGFASIFGPETAKFFDQWTMETLAGGRSIYQSASLDIGGNSFVFHAVFVPIPYNSSNNDAVLVSLHDVTLLEEAQRRQTQLMGQLVRALMRAIDLHDPYSINHSAKTATVAAAIGSAMQLKDQDLRTLEIAAELCNLGKLSIPRELLAKTGPLSLEEQSVLQQETVFAGEILARIDFDGPVLDTIAQKHELLDGSGYPQKLTGEAIIRTARILSVANAFVAMISPRAYRDKLSRETALDAMLRGAGEKYDRQVVAALFQVVENEIDWSKWEKECHVPSGSVGER
ncbi:MAG: HD domain-containing protein [Desulfobulbaceae bacterium]|nr:HD domain-containing protein [Desulfobulbaceae bacterium]